MSSCLVWSSSSVRTSELLPHTERFAPPSDPRALYLGTACLPWSPSPPLPPSRSSSPLLHPPLLQSPPATKPHTPPSSSTQTSTFRPRPETFVWGACPWPRPTDLPLDILTQQGSSPPTPTDRPTDPNRWPEPYTSSDHDDVDDADDSLHFPPCETTPSFRGTHLPKTSPLATDQTGHTYRTTRDFITLSSSHYATTQTTTPGPAP